LALFLGRGLLHLRWRGGGERTHARESRIEIVTLTGLQRDSNRLLVVFARERVARLCAPSGDFLVAVESKRGVAAWAAVRFRVGLATFDDFLFEMERVTALDVCAALAARADFLFEVGRGTAA